jgi:hypothetical protein
VYRAIDNRWHWINNHGVVAFAEAIDRPLFRSDICLVNSFAACEFGPDFSLEAGKRRTFPRHGYGV